MREISPDLYAKILSGEESEPVEITLGYQNKRNFATGK